MYYRIYQALQRFPVLLESLESNSNTTLQALITSPTKELLADTEKLQEMVESTLDLSLVDKGEFLVKPEFDDDLKGIRKILSSQHLMYLIIMFDFLTHHYFCLIFYFKYLNNLKYLQSKVLH